jgi:hypothetical protein
MIANILITLFVTAFITITAFGHALLIAAVWPRSFSQRWRLLADGARSFARRQRQTKTTLSAHNKERLLES